MLMAGLAAPTPAAGQEAAGAAGAAQVLTVVDSLVGAVGGVAVDGIGAIYVADFGETVYKVQPDGRVSVFATGLYGASGNAIGPRGELYQANFSGHYVSRVDRDGSHEIFAEGFRGPVGVAVDPDGGLYVNNCQGNSVSRVTADGEVTELASGDLFNCPNGIVRHPGGDLYVVNFSDGRMVRITPGGDASLFAEIPGGGNGHVAFTRGNFYVTAFQSHRIFQVTPEGEVTLLTGSGTPGQADGNASEATFSWPNGIAVAPTGDRFYVNDYLNRTPPTATARPVPRSSLRMVKLPSVGQVMAQALRSGGIEAMESAYRQFKSDPATSGLYTEFDLNALGYQLMGSGQVDPAIRVFELNVESYPQSFNVYDSLAEAYMTAGDENRAIEFYERSLEINPGNTNATTMIDRIRSGE